MEIKIVDYFEVKKDSSSSLKVFAEDRRKYYKIYGLGEHVEEKYNQAQVVGSIVDCCLLSPETFNDRFFMSTCSSVPTGLMLEFVEALYRCSINMIGVKFEDKARAAYEQSGYKIPFEQVLKKFSGSQSEVYFNEILSVRGRNLTVVTTEDMSNAERVIIELRSNFVTSHIINLGSDERFNVLNQFQILDFEVDGWKFKCMQDKVIVDQFEKTVQIYDLKCTWNVENFFVDYYLYRKSYIQAYLYYKAWSMIVKDPTSPYYGFTVLNPQFIVCDSINYMNPLIFRLSDDDLMDAYMGFEYKGRWYKGVGDIIQDLKFAVEENIWNISRENYEAKGVINLRE